MRIFRLIVPVLAVFICIVPPAAGQGVDTPPTGLVFGAGMGEATGGGAFLGFLGDLALTSPAGDFVVRGASVLEIDFLSSSAETAWDVGILYGRMWRRGTAWLRLSAGPAYVRSTEAGPFLFCYSSCEGNGETADALGLALQADGVWALSRGFGLGLAAFADMNSTRSFAGLIVGFYAGTLR